MVVRISDKTQNYSKVTKLLVKPLKFVIQKRENAQVLQVLVDVVKSTMLKILLSLYPVTSGSKTIT